MSSGNVTERFSDRVADYVKYRPTYPVELVRVLERELGIAKDRTRIVDLGSGTGISAELFLGEGYAVTGVEPNPPMRAAAEEILAKYTRWRSVDGTAERTTLPDASCELVIAAQAFHWFDVPKARVEAKRILAAGGHAALVWNDRKLDCDPFHVGYEAALVRWGTDYVKVRHANVGDETIRAFFGGVPRLCVLENHQDLDHDGLIGRALSSSYVPKKGQPGHDELLAELERLFAAHASGALVRVFYETKVWMGTLG
jgi:SAM-dependent methyltransferase